MIALELRWNYWHPVYFWIWFYLWHSRKLRDHKLAKNIFLSDEVSESKKQKTWNGEKARPVNASVTAKQAEKVFLFIVDVLYSQFLSQLRYTAQKSSFTVNFPK